MTCAFKEIVRQFIKVPRKYQNPTEDRVFVQRSFRVAVSHQEPVDVHEQQCRQQSVEEKVERDVGDGLQAGNEGGIQHFEGEPVQSEAKPVEETGTGLREGLAGGG